MNARQSESLQMGRAQVDRRITTLIIFLAPGWLIIRWDDDESIYFTYLLVGAGARVFWSNVDYWSTDLI